MKHTVSREGSAIDVNHAIQIAPRVWWVGHVQEDDSFQCHVYLVEQGDSSILIDPGSKLTFSNTLKKIEEIIPFSSIKYFLCQHQDPDIAGAMPLIDQMLEREDALLVTHWRAKMLLKHYGLSMPFWLIDENGWKLQLKDRTLEFCFTPYAHFPGAFTTFDPESGIMFSSDIFGGLTDEFSLFAADETYLESMKPFHQHYMPTNEILQNALAEIEKYPMKMIAPQHGSIIPQHLISFMIDGLKRLDCGLYLLMRESDDFHRLSHFNESLKKITRTMMIYRDFRDIATALLKIIRSEIPVIELEYFVRDIDDSYLKFAEKNYYRGIEVIPPASVLELFDKDIDSWKNRDNPHVYELRKSRQENGASREHLMLPLFLPDKGSAEGVILMQLDESEKDGEKLDRMLEHMGLPLQIAIEREMLYREMDRARESIYRRSIRDPLTGLYTRIYMNDLIPKMMTQQDRGSGGNILVVMLDIDHFKNINDTYGHNQGDVVLKTVSEYLLNGCREADIPVRLGGEEFILFTNEATLESGRVFAERLRGMIEQIQWVAPMNDQKLTASFGIALRSRNESLSDLIERADSALYRAKNNGRNCIFQNPVSP